MSPSCNGWHSFPLMELFIYVLWIVSGSQRTYFNLLAGILLTLNQLSGRKRYISCLRIYVRATNFVLICILLASAACDWLVYFNDRKPFYCGCLAKIEHLPSNAMTVSMNADRLAVNKIWLVYMQFFFCSSSERDKIWRRGWRATRRTSGTGQPQISISTNSS